MALYSCVRVCVCVDIANSLLINCLPLGKAAQTLLTICSTPMYKTSMVVICWLSTEPLLIINNPNARF